MPGLALLVAAAAVYDTLAAILGWEMISTGVRRIRRNPWGAMAFAAAVAALIEHFEESAP